MESASNGATSRPPEVSRLLQSFAMRRYARVRKPELPAAKALSRLSPPLLKHGT